MSIKLWNEDDRPREKLYLKGKGAVSDSELIAILIGMGTKDKSALDLAKEMLADNENSIEKLSKRNVKELMKYKGIGQAKAITIAAALELGNRKQSEPKQEIRTIKSSNDSYQILNYHFQGLHQEEFYILLLNKALKPLKVERISIGNTDATLVDIKIIAKCALENLAQAIVLAHNHPSGRLQPSIADENLTKKIKNAMTLLDITLVDHLIITDNGYYSFADEGKI